MHLVEKEFVKFMNKNKSLNFKQLNIAYSGGVDSEVLLFLASKYFTTQVLALHVNHGISNNAIAWENNCLNNAKKYNVDIKVAHFQLANEKSNLEEKARILRYGFFEDNMTKDTALLTGHHMDDQAETFFLRLMRGSGVDGLGAMRPVRDFSKGKLIRPFLTVTKDDLIDFALKHDLTWVEDESNKDTHYDRNFIRNEVMPLLKTRWKKASHLISRSAMHCQEASISLEEKNQKELLEITIDNNKLDRNKFKSFTKEKQISFLRLWIKKQSNVSLDLKVLHVILSEVIYSHSDSNACYQSKDFFIRVFKDKIYFIKKEQKIDFIVSNSLYEVKKSDKRIENKILINGVNKKIKDVLKEKNIPYWERNEYSLFFNKENQLVAVGDIFSDYFNNDFVVEKKYI